MKHYLLILFIILFIQTSGFSQNDNYRAQNENHLVTNNQIATPDLKIYPNPVRNQKVTLEMNSDEITEVLLVNLVGKEILKKDMPPGTNKYLMQLENVPKGIYLIQVKTLDKKTVVKKLLIQGN